MKAGKIDKYTVLSVILLGLIVMAIVLYEIGQSRNDLLEAHVSEAENLIDAIGNSIENNSKASRLIDEFLTEKLNVFSAATGRFYTENRKNTGEIISLMNEFNIGHVSIADYYGRIVFTSRGAASDSVNLGNELANELKYMIDNNYSWYELGNIYNPVESREMFMFARSFENHKLIVLAGIDSDSLLEFRKQAGIGRLIKDFSKNKDIIYLVLQDISGIYAASPGINEISSIEEDTFVKHSWQTGEFKSRITDYKDDKILEGIKSFKNNNDDSKYIVRLALSVEKVRSIQQGAMIRAIIMGAGIFITGGIIIALLNIMTRLGRLKLEHRRMKQYTSHILGNINNAIVAIDNSMNIIALNEISGKIFGIDTQGIIGKNYNEIFPGDEINLVQSLTYSKPISPFGLKLKSRMGEERILEVYNSLVLDENEDIEFAISIIIDMTEKVRAEEDLRRKDKLAALGELAGGVAHEIRNPLNSISVISQRFELEFEPKSDSEEFYKLAGIIKSETKRMNNIIKQFLEFAKPPKLNPVKGDIVNSIKNTILLIEGDAKNKNIEINRTGCESVIMYFDKEKLKQALLNLFKNALDAMENGGTLTVDVLKNKESAIIEVNDTGTGIPDDTLGKIFNLYFSTKDNGSGIGLSIVNQIISEHGGNITVESRVNEGSKFIISLPISEVIEQ